MSNVRKTLPQNSPEYKATKTQVQGRQNKRGNIHYHKVWSGPILPVTPTLQGGGGGGGGSAAASVQHTVYAFLWGSVVSASDSGSGGCGFDSQPSHVVIALGKQFTLTFPSPPTCKMGTQL